MRKTIEMGLAAAALALLGGCGGGDSNAPTAEENAQLDNAADMLDTSPDSLTVENPTLGNGDAPAATGDVLVGGDAASDNAADNAVNATAPDATNAQ